MFSWWGTIVVRFRWPVLATGLMLAVLGAGWGTGVFDVLTGGGFADPRSESTIAADRIDDELGDQDVDILVLYSSQAATVDQPAFRDPVLAALRRLRERPEVASARSYYDMPPAAPGVPPNPNNGRRPVASGPAEGFAPGTPTSPLSEAAGALVSTNRHATFVAVRLRATDEDRKSADFERLRPEFAAGGAVHTQTGGLIPFLHQATAQTTDDITKAELLSMPILLVLLVLIFGGLVAASTPLIIGGLAILGGFTVTRLLTTVTDVSVFAINVITLIGLGLAIDYALFMVSRFREELSATHHTATAIQRTMATAGRTVMVSGLTIIIALASLLLFPQVFLRSMGLGGMAAVLVAMLASLTVLPALLAILGPRIDALRVPLPWRRGDGGPTRTDGAWARLARSVMRRPVRYLLGVLVVLAVLAIPSFDMRWGGLDERVLPTGSEARVVGERIAGEFAGTVSPIAVLVSGAPAEQAQGFVGQISRLPGVTGARITAIHGDSALIEVGYPGESTGDVAQDLVRTIRDLPSPGSAEVLVGGRTAADMDLLDSLGARLPWMALIMACATLVLLFLAFGSVVLPIKAVLMNLVSIGASFGVVVWGFQEGHLADLLGFTSTGFIEPTNPILMLAVLFGLATDYEVFLLSRVREEWDRTGDNTSAVAAGLQHTGRIITAAALLLIVVVAGFATGGIMIIKLIGVGMIAAILVDATLVRALLVPATMRLLGRWNWWAPGPLGRVYRRFGIHEDQDRDREGLGTPPARVGRVAGAEIDPGEGTVG